MGNNSRLPRGEGGRPRRTSESLNDPRKLPALMGFMARARRARTFRSGQNAPIDSPSPRGNSTTTGLNDLRQLPFRLRLVPAGDTRAVPQACGVHAASMGEKVQSGMEHLAGCRTTRRSVLKPSLRHRDARASIICHTFSFDFGVLILRRGRRGSTCRGLLFIR